MNMSVLGKFAVVMADPPWDIHMELPYGTMSDDEMRRLSIPVLQDDGYIFLWVTGRSDDYSQTLVRLLIDAIIFCHLLCFKPLKLYRNCGVDHSSELVVFISVFFFCR